MFEYSISLYCFNPLMKSGDVTAKGAMRFARSVGFQAIEMLDMYWRPDRPVSQQAASLKADAAAECVGISCYTVANNLAIFDEGPWRKLADRMLADVETAAELGAPVMRVESTGGSVAPHEEKTFEECLEPVARGLKLVARRAQECGVKVGLENHGRMAGTSQRVLQVIDAVGEDNFGACLDIGNFLVVDQDPVEAVTQLAPRAVHVHVKDMHHFSDDPGPGSFRTNAGDFLVGAIFGEGSVDVKSCLDIIARAGYSGALSLEFEGRENLFTAVARACENLVETVRRLPLSR